MRRVAVVVAVFICLADRSARADDLQQALELAWAKNFAASEALYRSILSAQPSSRAAQLGLAQVVLWQERYREAHELFRAVVPPGADSVEGMATAAYWSGDLRTAQRHFRRALELDNSREFSRRSLTEIDSLARPAQRFTLFFIDDDQPLDRLNAEVEATHYSDPLTRWSVRAGGYRMNAGSIGTSRGEYLRVANETNWRAVTIRAGLGVFTFPDGVRRPIGHLALLHGPFALSVTQQEELATATALRTHATSRTTALRWSHEKAWVAAAEVSHRRHFDANEGMGAVLYGVAPLARRGSWTLWGGASAAFRDTDESRFRVAAVSSTLEGNEFRYDWRGQHDPYWTPRDLREARGVVALEFREESMGIKFHGDAGVAADRARAFGPDTGATPLPTSQFDFEFDRQYRPFRFGFTADRVVAAGYRIELHAERSVTIDYRSTTIHASLVRRR
jgi:hypothetical protein